MWHRYRRECSNPQRRCKMDVDTVVVFERMKRCISTAKLEAKKGHNNPALQRMEEIEALFEILERKVNGLSDV